MIVSVMFVSCQGTRASRLRRCSQRSPREAPRVPCAVSTPTPAPSRLSREGPPPSLPRRDSAVTPDDSLARRALEMRWAAPDVAFTGYLAGEELAAAYASADLFVFPSRTDTFGNAVLEAMASRLPPVVAREGGPAEQVRHGETGLVVDLDRPEALSDALQALLAHDGLRHRLGAAARSHAATCSWDRLLGVLFPGVPAAEPARILPEAGEAEREEAIAAAS